VALRERGPSLVGAMRTSKNSLNAKFAELSFPEGE
jgi:hypothetical protein